jgi:hypothetical protein
MFGGSLIKLYKKSDVQSLPISITKRHHVRLKCELFRSTAPSKQGCGVKHIYTEVQRSRSGAACAVLLFLDCASYAPSFYFTYGI